MQKKLFFETSFPFYFNKYSISCLKTITLPLLRQFVLMSNNNNKWTEVISPKSSIFNLKLKELYNYRDLVLLFVRRDFLAVYKQTVLGPLWYVVQPLMTAAMLWFMFGKIAGLGTNGHNKLLFYYSGVIVWQYFSQNLIKISNTFVGNAGLFGKVYFPRLSVPFSLIISNLIGFGIQFIILIIFLLYFSFQGEQNIVFDGYLFFVIIDLLIIAALGLGIGLIITSFTTKYKDLVYFITFGIQLLMYTTPVIIPMSEISAPFDLFVSINPMTSVIENFRGVFLRSEGFYDSFLGLLYSGIFSVFVLFLGLMLFNKTEKNFMDTV